MKDILKDNDLLKPPKVGEIIEGKIIGTGRSAVYVDLGIFGTGIIFGREFYQAKNELKNLKIGSNLFAKIIEMEDEKGFLELSLSEASSELTWQELSQKKEAEETITIKISGVNKGGLLSNVSGIPAFLPVSQLKNSHYPRVEKGDSSKILQELQKFIGQEMKVRIFDVSEKEKKLILSEKAKETEKFKEILKKYEKGEVVKGEITGITDFGAFMKFAKEKDSADIIEGLIHISELDWQLIETPTKIVKIGQKIKAKIIDISNNKVSLSLKALKKDPWQDIEKKYKKGDAIKGKVSKFNPFGAFIEITPEIQGLCHISEFGTKIKMEEALEIDKKYNFQILEIRPEQHRMTLKLEK